MLVGPIEKDSFSKAAFQNTRAFAYFQEDTLSRAHRFGGETGSPMMKIPLKYSS